MMLDGAVPSPLETGDPTWYLVGDLILNGLAAAGTLAAVVVAIRLGARSLRDNQRLQDERERAQAERITLVRRPGQPPEPPYLTVHNESDQLISAVRVVALGALHGEDGNIDLISPAGEWHTAMTGAGEAGNVAVVEFDDAANRTWIRTTSGKLERARRRSNGSSLHVVYRTDSEPRELASITASLRHGALLLAYHHKAEARERPAAQSGRRVRRISGAPRGLWSRRVKR